MSYIKNIFKFLSPRHQNLFLDYNVNFKPRYGYGKPAHTLLLNTIDANRNIYKDYLEKALSYSSNIQSIKRHGEDNAVINPTWNNGFLPGLDIIGIYTIVSEVRPKKYIEIGSGNSTKVAFKAKKIII